MWTQNYNGPLKNVFAVQDEIVDKVVTTLGLLFKLEEMRLPHGGPSYRTQNLEAFDDLLRAEEGMWRLTKDGNASARQWAERVIELDPKYPMGYAVLGEIYWESSLFQWSENPQADLERSRKLAQEALALDDSNVYALTLLAGDDWMLRRFDQAVAEGERAVAINPNYAEGYVGLAIALNASNRPEEALRAIQKAAQLDPSRHETYAFYAATNLVLMGSTSRRFRYSKATSRFTRTISLHTLTWLLPTPSWAATPTRVQKRPRSCGSTQGSLGARTETSP
jgi:adenylate cyclase